MTIPEAIEELRKDVEALGPDDYERFNQAVQLGREALIFTINFLKLMPIVFPLPPPGETKEGGRQ